MAKKKVTKKKSAKKVKPTKIPGQGTETKVNKVDAFIEAVVPGIVFCMVVGALAVGGSFIIDESVYQKDMCYAHSNNSIHYKTYAKIKYNWLSSDNIDYEFSSIDRSKIGIDRYEITDRMRTLPSFKELYDDEIDCALYEAHKVDTKLEQLKAKLEKKK